VSGSNSVEPLNRYTMTDLLLEAPIVAKSRSETWKRRDTAFEEGIRSVGLLNDEDILSLAGALRRV
jgi:hypothetical protein